LDFEKEKNLHSFLVEAAQKRLLASSHDCSDGGLAVTLAESAIQGSLGAALEWKGDISVAAALFGETQSRAAVSVRPDHWEATEALLKKHRLSYTCLGKTGGKRLTIRYNEASVDCGLDDISHLWNDSIAEAME
jgi:phosphoribosylformylglycinamidine synthase